MAVVLACVGCECQQLEIVEERGKLHYKCPFCRNSYAVSDLDDSTKLKLNQATELRQSAEFDRAARIYREIINEKGDSCPEAYFGAFLCDYNVLFERNDKTGMSFPSFYRMMSTPVSENENLRKAKELAQSNEALSAEMRNSEDLIENARKKYYDIQENNQPFNVFISFKVTANDGTKTEDFFLAHKLYTELSRIQFMGKQKYNIFFSEVSLNRLKGNITEYEPNIYYALHTSQIMLLICSEKEYVESQWVKNEWSRFQKIKGDNRIVPIFTRNAKFSELPPEITKLNGFKEEDINLATNIDQKLEEIIYSAEVKAELKRKEEEERAERERRDREKIASLIGQVGQGGASAKSLIENAKIELEDRSFEKCIQYCERAREVDPRCSEAYFLLFLATNKMVDMNDMTPIFEQDWVAHRYFGLALKNANAEERVKLQGYVSKWMSAVLVKMEAAFKETRDRGSATKYIELIDKYIESFGAAVAYEYYLFRLRLEVGCFSNASLVSIDGLEKHNYFKKAREYATQEQKARLEELIDEVAERAKSLSSDIDKEIAEFKKVSDEASNISKAKGEEVTKYKQMMQKKIDAATNVVKDSEKKRDSELNKIRSFKERIIQEKEGWNRKSNSRGYILQHSIRPLLVMFIIGIISMYAIGLFLANFFGNKSAEFAVLLNSDTIGGYIIIAISFSISGVLLMDEKGISSFFTRAGGIILSFFMLKGHYYEGSLIESVGDIIVLLVILFIGHSIIQGIMSISSIRDLLKPFLSPTTITTKKCLKKFHKCEKEIRGLVEKENQCEDKWKNIIKEKEEDVSKEQETLLSIVGTFAKCQGELFYANKNTVQSLEGIIFGVRSVGSVQKDIKKIADMTEKTRSTLETISALPVSF